MNETETIALALGFELKMKGEYLYDDVITMMFEISRNYILSYHKNELEAVVHQLISSDLLDANHSCEINDYLDLVQCAGIEYKKRGGLEGFNILFENMKRIYKDKDTLYEWTEIKNLEKDLPHKSQFMF